MRKGKMVAQGSHSSNAILLDALKNGVVWEDGGALMSSDPAMEKWLSGKFTKICVSVNSEEELLEIHKKAIESKIPAALIRDAGLTEFNGVPTLTCCAIGPAWVEEVDAITGKLQLL